MATWEELAAAQECVLSHRQLRQGKVTHDFVEAQVAAHRWARRTPMVVTTTTGPLSVDQLRWVGVLHAGGDSVVGALTAAEIHGLKNWTRDEVTVLVDQESSFDPVRGVTFFRTRRPLKTLRSARKGVPVAGIEPAILLFAAHERSTRTAHGAIAATVQQGLTTPAALRPWIRTLAPLRRASGFRQLLDDIDGGSRSVAELDVVRACRDHGLVPPTRQVKRRDRAGKQRFTDCEWDLPDGTTLVLEVDGAFHLDVEQYTADVARQRGLSHPGRLIVRCTAYELRQEPWVVIDDLISLGVPRAPA